MKKTTFLAIALSTLLATPVLAQRTSDTSGGGRDTSSTGTGSDRGTSGSTSTAGGGTSTGTDRPSSSGTDRTPTTTTSTTHDREPTPNVPSRTGNRTPEFAGQPVLLKKVAAVEPKCHMERVLIKAPSGKQVLDLQQPLRRVCQRLEY